MIESELAKHFIEYFELDGFDVYQEVPAYGIIDIVAKKGNIITAVEVKTSLNFNVFEQGFRNKQKAHYSYIAVPHARRSSFTTGIIKQHGIGILEYNKWGYDGCKVKEIVPPSFNRKVGVLKLESYMKKSVAGSKNNRITPFKNSISLIKSEIIRSGGKAKISTIIHEGNYYHWGSLKSARHSVVEMCKRGVISDFKHISGFLIITENG